MEPPDTLRDHLRKIARSGGMRGGKSRSQAKVAAARANIAKALAVRLAKRKAAADVHY